MTTLHTKTQCRESPPTTASRVHVVTIELGPELAAAAGTLRVQTVPADAARLTPFQWLSSIVPGLPTSVTVALVSNCVRQLSSALDRPLSELEGHRLFIDVCRGLAGGGGCSSKESGKNAVFPNEDKNPFPDEKERQEKPKDVDVSLAEIEAAVAKLDPGSRHCTNRRPPPLRGGGGSSQSHHGQNRGGEARTRQHG